MIMTPTLLKEYLSSNNIKPSYPRIKIFEYVYNSCTHPSVDEIYLTLVAEMPTLSKTTVYNTLKLLMDHNLVRLVSIEDNEARYDGNVCTHGHFKCESCGRIYDFTVDLDKCNTDDLKGYEIHEKNIYFKGICNTCKK